MIRQLDPDLKVSVQIKKPEPWPNSTVIRWQGRFIEFRGKPVKHEEKLPDKLMYARGLRGEVKEKLERAQEENAPEVEARIERFKIRKPTVTKSELETTRNMASNTPEIRRLKDELHKAEASVRAWHSSCTMLNRIYDTEASGTDNGWTVKNHGCVVAEVLISTPSS